MGVDSTSNYDDVSMYGMNEDREQELLANQKECTLIDLMPATEYLNIPLGWSNPDPINTHLPHHSPEHLVRAGFGATMDNIVDATFFVTHMEQFISSVSGVYGARAEAYGGLPDVSQTVVQVVALVQPELTIEITRVAHW